MDIISVLFHSDEGIVFDMGPRLLIIDDDVSLSKLLAKHLRTKKLEVLTATDTKEGKETIKKEKPDIVLLDVALPDQSGVGFVKTIKSIDKNIPIIMISGYGDMEIVVSAMKVGASDYIQKPIEHEELWGKITKLLPKYFG